MIEKHFSGHSREKFVSPRVTQAVGLDLEDVLLANSVDFKPEVTATGHESEDYNLGDYWE